MSDEHVSRRCFIRGTATLGAGVVVASMASGKGDDDDEKSVTISFFDNPELKKVGGSAEAELPDGTPILVAQVEEGKFVCVQLSCTHQKSQLDYDAKAKLFHCPAHDSRFDLEGKPLNGPATKPLACYTADGAVVVQSKPKKK